MIDDDRRSVPRIRSRGALLSAVSSEADVISVLTEFARETRRPWGRVEVLRYLPIKWHSLAEEFFEGSSLRLPSMPRRSLEEPEHLTLDEALHRAEQRPTPDVVEVEQPHTPLPLDRQLEAAPPTGEDDIIGQVLDAVREETLAVDRKAPKRYQLSNGRCIGARGDSFAYLFRWSSEPDLHEPGTLQLGRGSSYDARITGQGMDDKHFELTVDSFLGATIARAVFRVDPTFLLRTVFEQLKQRRDAFPDAALATSLFRSPDSVRVTEPAVEGLNQEQAVALRTTLAAARTYVWGPPGTGKTRTLGRFIRAAADAGKRTLVISPYNIAVDEALVAARTAGGWTDEDLVRFGRTSEKIRSAGLTLEQHLEKRARASGLLEECRAMCAAAERECGQAPTPAPRTVQLCLERLGELIIALPRGATPQRSRMATALKKYRALFRAPEEIILKHARVVGTTVALAYLSQKVNPEQFDHVVVDEASVLRVPEVILLALRCAGKLAFFGDPKQLPAIVNVSSDKSDRWIRRNPFDLAGIASPADARGSCVMLEEQHRMAPPIRELVSTKFYSGRLRDGHVPSGGRLLLIDTSETSARAATRYTKRSASMENVLHRSIASEFIRAVHRSNSEQKILILSPYAAQRRGYDREPNSKNVRTARFATVHASQGTESDVVVFDFVFAPGRKKSTFLNSFVRPDFRNLLNVGLSRAREQLVLVAHTRAIRDHYEGTLLAELIDYFEERAEVVRVPASLEMVRLFRGVVEGNEVGVKRVRSGVRRAEDAAAGIG